MKKKLSISKKELVQLITGNSCKNNLTEENIVNRCENSLQNVMTKQIKNFFIKYKIKLGLVWFDFMAHQPL